MEIYCKIAFASTQNFVFSHLLRDDDIIKRSKLIEYIKSLIKFKNKFPML